MENTLFWEGPEYLKEKFFELQLTSNMEGVDNTSVFNEGIKTVSNFVLIVSKCESIDNSPSHTYRFTMIRIHYRIKM